MSFASLQILWLLLVFPPALLAFFWWSGRVRQKLMAQFIQSRLLPGLITGVSSTRQKIRTGLLIGAVVFIIIALARPQWGYFEEEVAQRGLDIIVAVDTSKSMLASDIAPNRLTRAKLAAIGLMQQAKSDRLGVVAFAGSAFLECPLTFDNSAFQQSVDALDVHTISEGGSSLSEAIKTAAQAFKEGDNYKVLVLFTDGEDNDTDAGAIQAAQSAAKDGMRIFTVGIGTAAGELLQNKDANGNLEYIRDEQGNVVKSHLNEALLKQIAADADGSYYSLSGANTMDALYERSLAPLPKSDSRSQWLKQPYERYHWFLAVAILLLIAEIFFPERRPKAHHDSKNQLPRAGTETGAAAAAVATLVMFMCITASAGASPASALNDYKAGKFTDAQKEFERLAETNSADARLVFDAGDAAYRATNYDEALKCFTAALASPDVKLQQKSYFNIGNAQYRLGENAKDLDGVQQQWEQAIKSFQNAVVLDTNDVDAVHNLEFTKKNVAMIEQLRQAALRAKQEADNSVRQRNYHRALDILQQAVQNNIAAKQFKDYVKRLKDIDDIATPNQH
ncbi:MAG TPA: VWA domain-containing protein [Verrucomicrobiae bacterium]|jgi:Ca-activated chloride channel family protein|nr:VWA domain-containing protein [Verrucomicrobiae bacterium]